MKRLSSSFACAALAAGLLAGCAAPSGTASGDARAPLVAVTHVDVARARLDGALDLLRAYAAATRSEPGNLDVEVLRQASGNHFTLIERWATRGAFEAHLGGAAARDFHRRFDPLLGSPHDERIYRPLATLTGSAGSFPALAAA